MEILAAYIKFKAEYKTVKGSILIIIFIIFCFLVTTGVILWYRIKMNKTIGKLNEMLDSTINGSFTETTYDESKLSVLEGKLKRYLSFSTLSAKNLKEEKENINSLISDISHQTKTPLSNILLYSGLLMESELTEEGLSYAGQIHAQSEKLNFLIQALVKTSRLETGIISVIPEENPVSQLVRAAAEEIKPKAEGKNLLLFVRECQGTAFFDMKWTIEAVCNILDNAVKYTDPGGSIVVTGYPYEMFYRIDIADNGIGIEEEEQGQIFGRFYRSQKVNQYEGVGIGLFLTREIITSQGGYIKASGTPGGGSTFSVFLPVERKE